MPVLSHRVEYVELAPKIPRKRPGPPLVFLHEGLGSLSAWRDFPRHVVEATGCSGIVYSRAGHGQSDPTGVPRRSDYLHVEARAALPELLVHLRVDRPLLVGHSDGATIALIHAASGFAVRGVVAMAPHVFVEDVTIAGVRAARVLYESSDWRKRLARRHRDPDGTFYAWNDTWLAPWFHDWSVEALLPSIRCPLLLLQGENDEYGSLEQLVRIARSVPTRVESLALAGVGHSPWREAEDAVVSAIAGFVDELTLETHPPPRP